MTPAPTTTEEPEAKTGIAKVGDITVARNRSLRTSGLSGWSDIDGGESSVATNGQDVLITSNDQDAISTDGGNTFTDLNPTTVFPNTAGGFCCDQVVAYIPRVHRFVWVLQYRAGSGGTANKRKVERGPDRQRDDRTVPRLGRDAMDVLGLDAEGLQISRRSAGTSTAREHRGFPTSTGRTSRSPAATST